jgi:UDP-N-acetyl-D-mannosaminuronate dehydrogenase
METTKMDFGVMNRVHDAEIVWKTVENHYSATPPIDAVLDFLQENDLDRLNKPISPLDDTVVAVVGVGYVGLHLVGTFAQKYPVIAFDVSEKRLKAVQPELSKYQSVTLTKNPTELAQATHFLIAVPTLLLPDKSVDTSYLRNAISTVALYARPGATIVVESSVAVGMTRELLGPLMRSRNLMAGMSPEVIVIAGILA